MCIRDRFGGAGSGVSESTTSIFLESACFDAVTIRRTARRHGLNTDASFRFERGVDPGITVYALKRSALLLKEVAGAKISSTIIDIAQPCTWAEVDLHFATVDRLCGVAITPDAVVRILEMLDCRISERTAATVHVQVPPYRVDVLREADLVEEMLRIHGFDQVPIPERLMMPAVQQPETTSEGFRQRLSQHLAARGFREVMTPSLVNGGRTVKLKAGETRSLDVMIRSSVIGPVTVTDDRLRDAGIDKLNARTSHFQPSLGDVNSLLQGSLGVMTRNELSSGYNVRGGNFDENLVYVNGIEVYRPFLVRSGQQEGLSFPNPDMIERIHFSAGGWEPRYGDKLSSVLDITYKRPREFDAIASASLLGGSVTVGSAMAHQRLRQITGFRYRTLSTVLKGLDTQGDYVPTYTDLQSYWTYDLSDKVEIGFLGLYSRNRYDVTPKDRETALGNFNQALRYTVYFEGQDRTAYEKGTGALSLTARPSPRTVLKFTGSAFNTYETERMDILGEYRLGELDRNLASEQFGEVVRDLGIGAYLEHARNSLEATVLSATHTGSFFWGRGNNLQWGLEARTERINDRLSEWYVVDSAGYSIPQSSGAVLELNTSVKTKIDLESVRTSAYLQNAWEWKTGRDRSWALVAGVRGQNWSYNGQTVFSPRLRLAYHPGWRKVVAAGDTVPLSLIHI